MSHNSVIDYADFKCHACGQYVLFLKKKLQKEGLFDPSNKKELPFLPKKIGVVTSSTGAAVRDIVSIIKRRYPPCNILIYLVK